MVHSRDKTLPDEAYAAFDTYPRRKEIRRDEVQARGPSGRIPVMRAPTDNLQEGGTAVQVGGTVQGARSIPRRGRRLEALLAVAAILVIAASLALVVWVFPLANSGVGAQDANPKAGAAAGAALVHDDAGNMPSGTGSGVVHDDAGNVR
jgi:hypothetical protein